MLFFQLLLYAFVMWFGLYLLRRNPAKAGLRYTAFGLLAYGIALSLHTIYQTSDAALLLRWRDALLLTPAIFWTGAILNLQPQPPNRSLNIGVPIAAALVFFIGFWFYRPAVALMTLSVFASVAVIANTFRQGLPQRPLVIALTATLFFGLGLGGLFLPFGILSANLVIPALAFDLVLLGIAVGGLDAYDEGETLWRDALRSLAEVTLIGAVIGSQVGAVMRITEADPLPFIVLLVYLLPTAFALVIYYRWLQNGLDQLVLAADESEERTQLRAVSEAIPRRDDKLNPLTLDEKEFTRLTRRALSHMGDLSRLASNPLIHLPVVKDVLEEDYSTLARANALRDILTEAILQLKPPDDGDFGTSDAWRYYNALYFPYVAGLKPYSRRYDLSSFSEVEREALAWFQAQVPERTLYNWQNKGAELIAVHLREQSRIVH